MAPILRMAARAILLGGMLAGACSSPRQPQGPRDDGKDREAPRVADAGTRDAGRAGPAGFGPLRAAARANVDRVLGGRAVPVAQREEMARLATLLATGLVRAGAGEREALRRLFRGLMGLAHQAALVARNAIEDRWIEAAGLAEIERSQA